MPVPRWWPRSPTRRRPVRVGQNDDPAEGVLEHILLSGDGYAWN
ncbi:hypothetical protein [Streptomyces olivaceus]|nr:hypothetical protein [Streptomyces olivaceus]